MPTTNYIWDEDNLLAEADQSNVVQTVYTNEPEQFGNLISTRNSGTTSYHQFDGLGSTRQLTNAGGTITDTMVYDAWGNLLTRTGATIVAMLWVGELGYYYDPETGSFHVRRRPLEPESARWTTVDPLGDSITSPRSRYAYANASPITYVDPMGLSAEPSLCGSNRKECGPGEARVERGRAKLALKVVDSELSVNVKSYEKDTDDNYLKIVRKDKLKMSDKQITVIISFALYDVTCCNDGDIYKILVKRELKAKAGDMVRTETRTFGVPTPPGPATDQKMDRFVKFAFPLDCWLFTEDKCLKEAGTGKFCPVEITKTTTLS